MHAPFEAYTGTSPYIFVSYAHRDAALVYPIITAWHEAGYRVWYDEGIDPGNEWPEEIANALGGCAQFVVFITPRAVDSKNVRNEINFALNRDKDFIAIHLEETELPAGLLLRMGDIQAIMKYRMTPAMFEAKMRKVFIPAIHDAATPPRGDAAPDDDAQHRRGRRPRKKSEVRAAARALRDEVAGHLARGLEEARDEIRKAAKEPPPRREQRPVHIYRTMGCLSTIVLVVAASIAFYFIYTRVIMKYAHLSSQYLSMSCQAHRTKEQKMAYLKKLGSEGDRETRIAALEQELDTCRALSYATQKAQALGLERMNIDELERYYLAHAPASHAQQKLLLTELRTKRAAERQRRTNATGSDKTVLDILETQYRSLLTTFILDAFEEEAPRQ